MHSITLNLDSLTPLALAAICAALSKDAEQAYDMGQSNVLTLAEQAQEVEEALVRNAGAADAEQMLREAGAIRSWLMKLPYEV